MLITPSLARELRTHAKKELATTPRPIASAMRRATALVAAATLHGRARAGGASDEDLLGGESIYGEGDDDATIMEMLSHEQMRGLHHKMDADGDGHFSLAELLEYAERIPYREAAQELAMSKDLDASKDGTFTMEELLRDEALVSSSNPEEFDAATLADIKVLEAAESKLKRLKFQIADANNDKVLSGSEVAVFFSPESYNAALAAEAMADKDTNKDGLLSKTEFFSDPANELFLEQESDITPEELADFEELDKDGSGDLDTNELIRWESGQYHAHGELTHMVKKADTDRNGKISPDEFINARQHINGTDVMYHLLEWTAHEEL